MLNQLEQFEKDLARKGCGIAPNGATYLLTTWGTTDIPAYVRTTPNGEREIIVGWCGEQFSSLADAMNYAIADGRHELAPKGTELSRRKQLA